MKIKPYHSIFIAISFLYFLGFSANIVLAQEGETYTFIEPLPGFQNTTDRSELFITYVSVAFRVALGTAAILAVLMIVVGGFQYTFSAATPSQKTDAKGRIWNAILGLFIVLASFAFLYTINPDFTDFSILEIPKIDEGEAINNSSSGGDNHQTPIDIGPDIVIPNAEEESALRNSLRAAGIEVNNLPCPEGSSGQGCTNLSGLKPETISGVIALNEACKASVTGPQIPCSVMITGGTEPGHSTQGTYAGHSLGEKVDLRPQPTLDSYIESITVKTNTIDAGPVREGVLPNGQRIRVIDERGGSQPHWDIDFL